MKAFSGTDADRFGRLRSEHFQSYVDPQPPDSLPVLGTVDVKPLPMRIFNPHLRRLPLNQILLHQPMALSRRLCRHTALLGRRIVRRISRLHWDPGLEVQHEPEGRVAIEIIPMQPLRAQETQVLVDAEGGGVVDFGFQGDLGDD